MGRHGRGVARRVAAAAAALLLGCAGALAAPTGAAAAAAAPGAYHEQYRPQFHYSPAADWMNDPNGLIYDKGVYNLFYQYNPTGNTWGDMSWGHATSTDLVHWTQQPLAIAGTPAEMIFSGSAVLDTTDSSGFGTAANPPLVAVYTSDYPDTGIQAQSLAYSTDGGMTWTKYAGNPVLNLNSQNFRDPKVFWYAPTKSWRMVVSLAAQDQVQIYSSPDLKSWKLLSTFGPDGTSDGVWEMPDLFPLALDGNPHDVKWVMVVGVDNKDQYFVGSFDGTTFTPDEPVAYTPPGGTVYEGFDGGTYDGWTATGDAFGAAPAAGTLPNQQAVSGYAGSGLVNSYNGEDGSTGELSSPTFTVDSPYLNFLVGGGDQPYVAGSVFDSPAPAGTVFDDFSGRGWGAGWTATGSFADTGPTAESLPGAKDPSVLDTCVAGCDAAEGTITSPTFTVSSDDIDFLVGGGDHPEGQPNPTAVNLLIGGKVVASATGAASGDLNWVSWATARYRGQQAQIQVVDDNDGTGGAGWGHLMVDDIVFANQAAAPYDRQAAVDLVIGGKVVASATGADSEHLDWTNFDLRKYQGRQAQIEIVDHATEGWGHILADQFTFADQPALGASARTQWVDDGADFYAAGTFEDAPGGRQIMIGWMNDWAYGQSIPTSPWRSADSIPRVLSLRTVDGVPTLEQSPVASLSGQRTGSPTVVPHLNLPQGTTTLPISGNELDLDTTLNAGTADDFGLEVATGTYSVTGAPQYTKIGYDRADGEVYIDRGASGETTFGGGFSAVQSAKLPLRDGAVSLRILVDASSVEVFADGGQVALTDQIFPDPGSVGVAAYADGGTASISGLTAYRVGGSWP